MIFVELIVNRPIRRSFRQAEPPPTNPSLDDDPFVEGIITEEANLTTYLDTFHYHVPVELETVIQPGHLVWAPFGKQQVQGIVVCLADAAPVPTRPLLRLARPEPVLTSAQVMLAIWIATYYVTPLAEAVKLFLPPGLLSKEDGRATVRTKREWQIGLAVQPAEIPTKIAALARNSAQIKILAWFEANPTEQVSPS